MSVASPRPSIVCRITEAFDLSAPTISHHPLLREAGLIVGERRGVWIYYTLDQDVVAQVAAALGALSSGQGVLRQGNEWHKRKGVGNGQGAG